MFNLSQAGRMAPAIFLSIACLASGHTSAFANTKEPKAYLEPKAGCQKGHKRLVKKADAGKPAQVWCLPPTVAASPSDGGNSQDFDSRTNGVYTPPQSEAERAAIDQMVVDKMKQQYSQQPGANPTGQIGTGAQLPSEAQAEDAAKQAIGGALKGLFGR